MSTPRKAAIFMAAVAAAAAFALGTSGPAQAGPPAAAAPSAATARTLLPGVTAAALIPAEQICTFQNNSDHCINRAGGGTGTGTHLITWHNGDNNNDFTFFQEFNWCGGTGTVRNGEGGVLCPFRNGSGLNARYDGRPVLAIVRDGDFGRCAVIPQFSNGPGVALGNCGDQGYAWVYTSFRNVVSVGQSNWRYDNFHLSNDPWWLYDIGLGSQLSVLPDATYTWGCAPVGGLGAC